jgi:hypothetical protein
VGLFKEPWEKEKAKKLKFIKKTFDQAELAKILQEPRVDFEVQMAALDRITDTDLLRELTCWSVSMGKKSLFDSLRRKLKGDGLLPSQQAIVAAKLADPDYSGSEIGQKILTLVTDQNLIFQIAMNSGSFVVRLEAAKQLEDETSRQSAFAAIVRSSVNQGRTAQEAFSLLDKAAQETIQQERDETDRARRQAKADKIRQQEYELTRLSQSELASFVYSNWKKNHKLAIIALDLISDQSILEKMSHWVQYEFGGKEWGSHSGVGVRHGALWEEACKRITDRSVLHSLIKNAKVSASAGNAEKRLRELDNKGK